MDLDRFGPIDFDRFHQEEIPALLAKRGAVFSASDAEVVRPLAFQLSDGRAYTYVPEGSSFSVRPGTDTAHTVVELSLDAWVAFAWELKTCFALLYAEQLNVLQGNFGQVARWEPPLRVAFSAQVLFDLQHPVPMEDDQGRALDPTRSFTLDDPAAGVRDFLHRVGFVHLRGVLDAAEVGALTADVEAAVDRARPDDRKSWWTTVDGREVCNRVNYLNEGSARIAALGADPRFLDIAALGGDDLRDAQDRLDGNGVVIKVPGSAGGLADLPWHRDCGMGGHPVKCPMLNVGIQLDAATAETGQLQMIPGSHRGTSRLPSARDAESHDVVALTTEPGDVTVHFGHTLHAAPPPTDPDAYGRRALYLSFVPPLTFEMVGPGQGYNDVLFTRSEGHVQHADQFR
ncbi:MAG TPA: phytanoyl-CoA dioxygenase family protein [Acidimicrobiales bacterium]|nr:phytanoyl-CoA dioxygenase family protein [Acidimicrobiales bacterium]